MALLPVKVTYHNISLPDWLIILHDYSLQRLGHSAHRVARKSLVPIALTTFWLMPKYRALVKVKGSGSQVIMWSFAPTDRAMITALKSNRGQKEVI